MGFALSTTLTMLAYLQIENAGNVFVIDGKINTINNATNWWRDQHDQQRNDDGMARLTMKINSDCWITHSEFSITVRSEYR